MSLDILWHYENDTPDDPSRLEPPSVQESAYPPRRKSAKNYQTYVKKIRRFRKLQLQLLECLDHESSTSERLYPCTSQRPESERPRVFKAFAEYETFQSLIVLKVVPPSTLSNPDNLFYQFDQEAIAYARLAKAGLCEAGYVPRYYGWYEFPPSWRSDPALAHISNHPRLSELPHSETPPRALLIEYLENASPISPWNITSEIAHEALRRFTEIHSIGLLHCDGFPRNLMVARDGKPVWIDFGSSEHSPHDRVRPQTQVKEYRTVASMLFRFLLADRTRVLRGEDIWYPNLYVSTTNQQASSSSATQLLTASCFSDESEVEALLYTEQDQNSTSDDENSTVLRSHDSCSHEQLRIRRSVLGMNLLRPLIPALSTITLLLWLQPLVSPRTP